MTPIINPIGVELDETARLMRIRWDDGHLGEWRWETLRRRCPCALCAGEDGGARRSRGAGGHGGERRWETRRRRRAGARCAGEGNLRGVMPPAPSLSPEQTTREGVKWIGR